MHTHHHGTSANRVQIKNVKCSDVKEYGAHHHGAGTNHVNENASQISTVIYAAVVLALQRQTEVLQHACESKGERFVRPIGHAMRGLASSHVSNV